MRKRPIRRFRVIGLYLFRLHGRAPDLSVAIDPPDLSLALAPGSFAHQTLLCRLLGPAQTIAGSCAWVTHGPYDADFTSCARIFSPHVNAFSLSAASSICVSVLPLTSRLPATQTSVTWLRCVQYTR